MKWLGLTVHYLSILIRNMLSFVHVLNLVPTTLEIAFSGIEILKILREHTPKNSLEEKSPLLIQSVTLFNLLTTSIIETPDPFFPATLPKEKYAHHYQFKLVKLVCHLIHLLGFSPAFSWPHDKSLAWESRMLLVVEVLEQP